MEVLAFANNSFSSPHELPQLVQLSDCI